MLRTRVAEIRETGRNAQGVRLMNVDDGERIVAIETVAAVPGGDSLAPEARTSEPPESLPAGASDAADGPASGEPPAEA
jgi:DNA gyrase subunit A